MAHCAALDDDTVTLVLRFAPELSTMAATARHFAVDVVPRACLAIANDQGFEVTGSETARLIYRHLLGGRSRRLPKISMLWHKTGIDAMNALVAVGYVEHGLHEHPFGEAEGVERKVICTQFVGREARIEFLGERWVLRLERRGALRLRHAAASRFLGRLALEDDAELSLECLLLPLLRCYPNCNCRYGGSLRLALLWPNGEVLRVSLTLTGCYTWTNVSDPAWHSVYQLQSGDDKGGDVALKVVLGLQCWSGDDGAGW